MTLTGEDANKIPTEEPHWISNVVDIVTNISSSFHVVFVILISRMNYVIEGGMLGGAMEQFARCHRKQTIPVMLRHIVVQHYYCATVPLHTNAI